MKYKLISPTDNELLLIKQNDVETINKYYLANLDFIRTITRAYFNKHREFKLYTFEDMAQEVYLYFSKLKFDKEVNFIRSVSDVCVFVRWGGERVFNQARSGRTEILTILDEPISRGGNHGGEPLHLYDVIPDDFDILEKVCPTKSYTDDIFNCLKDYLTPREKEVFNYFYYTDLTAREIGAKIGITINGAQSLKNSYMRRFRAKKENILNALSNMGYTLNIAL